MKIVRTKKKEVRITEEFLIQTPDSTIKRPEPKSRNTYGGKTKSNNNKPGNYIEINVNNNNLSS